MKETSNFRQSLEFIAGENEFSAYLMRLCDGGEQGMNIVPTRHILLAVETSQTAIALCEVYAQIVAKYDLLSWLSPCSFLALRYPLHATAMDHARFFESPSIAARPYTQFGGVFLIDISEWKAEMDTDPFKRFIQFVRTREESILFIFTINSVDAHIVSGFAAQLRQSLPIRQYIVDTPNVEPYFERARQMLNENGIQLSRTSASLLRHAISRLQLDAKWQGMETIHHMMGAFIIQVERSASVNEIPVLSRIQIDCLQQLIDDYEAQRTYSIGF